MSEALLFPGQGAQFPGMGRDWAERFPTAQALFAEADEVLGLPLAELCWERGDEVHRTDVAQPGILVTSVAIVSCLAERGLEPAPLAAGLSLGEYTALWFAGALSFPDAVRLVRLRGEAMQAASEQTPSSMTSLTGASPEQAERLAQIGRRHGICAVANYNAPGQIVLSGEIAALEAAEAAASEQGVRRTVRLTVAGGFHSECMRAAADRLAAALEEVEIRAPRIPVLANASAEPLGEPDQIRRSLAEQITSPVLWERSMRRALAGGVERFLEPGPGTVLSGLLRRIARDCGVDVSVRNVEHPGDLEG